MSQKHKDFKITYCGTVIDKDHPWVHATPDFMPSCSCCGNGCGEVKCPFSLENWDFDGYVEKESSCRCLNVTMLMAVRMGIFFI